MAATISVTTETIALTSFGMNHVPPITAVRSSAGSTSYGSIIAERGRRGLVGADRLAAKVTLQMTGAVAVKEMTDQAAVEIGGAHQPVGDREGEVHVHLHHQAL